MNAYEKGVALTSQRDGTYLTRRGGKGIDQDAGARLICVRCGATINLQFSSIIEPNQEAAVEAGFQVQSYLLEVNGLCQQCSVKER